MNEEKQTECTMVSRFEADKAIMHLNFSNRRMLIALLAVCATFIITISVFVWGYTVREKNWLDTLYNLQNKSAVTEVNNGTQPDADH